jgi:hypothetical protein
MQPRRRPRRGCGAKRYDAVVSAPNDSLEGANPTHAPPTESPNPRDRRAGLALFLAWFGVLMFPFGSLTLLWSGPVSFVMVRSAMREGRRVPRGAVAALVVTVVGPPVLWFLLPALLMYLVMSNVR